MLNEKMTCSHCKKEIERKSGVQKYCVPCGNLLNALRRQEEYKAKKAKRF
jgi:predicted RNA-binding Zn-ribbon protein involved in translation (DUF1610 family)